jgi:3-dehydrotetronate 4-kinase
MLLGCIADDFTGATDLAGTIALAGLSAVQVNGVPDADLAIDPADAVVVALKSRTIEASTAVEQSLAALNWLRSRGAQHIYFKVCSTFDSTPVGNIGPVADALCDAIGAPLNLVTPAYPRNARTVYQGHLFVGEALLSDTGMRTHPLTPMTDSNLVRVLAAQTRQSVGLLPHAVIAQGAAAVQAKLAALAATGCRHVIADSIDDAQLDLLGAAVAPTWLATGGSGLAAGMARSMRPQANAGGTASTDWPRGPAVILAGSCSTATLAQIERVKDRLPSLQLDPLTLARESHPGAAALDWAKARLGDRPLLIYASADPERVAAAQAALGREHAAQVVEHALRSIATGLAEAGVRRFVVAGGETSGAVVEALGVRALAIGPEIAPGVPWTRAADGKPYALALKSGNFGGPDFFSRAFDVAP